MAPKRKTEDLKLKSIWDETLVTEVMDNKVHRNKMWQWLVLHPDKDICDVPFASWRVKKASADAILKNFVKYTATVVERNESIRGDTTKLLLELQDGHRIETVIMRHPSHSTVCVSSQIGCQMGCRFCATGTMGIIGNLTSAEILEQLALANAVTKIRNVVFMGMGEPLNNYDNLKLAVEFMVDCNRFGLSFRHVTVSTVGVLKTMRRLSDELPYVSLALSLHAPNQEVRLKIVPAASAHHIDKLMEAVDYHTAKNREAYFHRKISRHGVDPTEANSNKRAEKFANVMIEYILIKDVNDLEAHAIELATLLAPRRENIILNLIPYNPTTVAEDYEPPTEESVTRFHATCIGEPFGIHTRTRQEKGQDIAGACGQLALVNPGKVANSADIEDAAGSRGTKKGKAKVASRGGKKESAEQGSGSSVSVNKLFCYVNIAIPVVLASLAFFTRP